MLFASVAFGGVCDGRLVVLVHCTHEVEEVYVNPCLGG